MVEKFYKPIEVIERIGTPERFTGRTTAVDFRGWLNGRISLFSKKQNIEYELLFKEILKAYDFYNKEKHINIEIEGWKGISSFKLLKEADKIIVKKFQRKSRGVKPDEIKFEFNKEEIISVIESIKKLNKGEDIKSLDIAFEYCVRMNINKTSKGKDMFDGNFREMFYSERNLHNRFTILLNILEKEGLISYKAGIIKVIDLNKEILK